MKSDYKFAIKTGFRIVIMITILFSLFILAAGSMRYWEAWVYCILLFLMMFSSFVYFLKKDIAFLKSRVLKRKEEDKTQKSLQNIFSIFFVIGFIIPGLDYRFNLSDVPFYLVLIADLFVVFGFLLIFRVSKENSYASAIIEVNKNQKVISTGPYKIVRHPMYVGDIIILLSTPIALGSFWALIPFLICTPLFFVLRIRGEEEYLKKNLPGYNEYCQKTRYRLIPYIW